MNRGAVFVIVTNIYIIGHWRIGPGGPVFAPMEVALNPRPLSAAVRDPIFIDLYVDGQVGGIAYGKGGAVAADREHTSHIANRTRHDRSLCRDENSGGTCRDGECSCAI